MNVSLFVYSTRGLRTAEQVRDLFRNDTVRAFMPARSCTTGFDPLPVPSAACYEHQFEFSDVMIFIGACGIAVREIAPYIRDKRTDPAVICIDAGGSFVIPILSGHIGGANELARKIAAELSAAPVITTATDVFRKFSVDEWASANGFVLSNMEAAKMVSAAILERDIPIRCDLPVLSAYPEGTFPADEGELGIYIGWKKDRPFRVTLQLIPRVISLGIGCRKGTPEASVREAVEHVLSENNIDRRAVRSAASIDLKSEEAGLLGYCKSENLPICFYSADTLRKVQGSFTHSDFVEQVTGVDNVCERAAMFNAERLLVPKTACGGVTVAAALLHQEVNFG